jgi:hypothetical protein
MHGVTAGNRRVGHRYVGPPAARHYDAAAALGPLLPAGGTRHAARAIIAPTAVATKWWFIAPCPARSAKGEITATSAANCEVRKSPASALIYTQGLAKGARL